MNKKAKLLGAILGIIFFVVAIAGITYAWLSWKSSNTDISGKTECFVIKYTNGQSLSTNDIYLFDESEIISNNKILIKDGMGLLNVTAGIDSTCGTNANLNIEINVTNLSDAYISGDSIGAFKYVLASYDPAIADLTELKGQYLDIINNNSITAEGPITLEPIALDETVKGYLIIFYVDGDLTYNDAIDSTFAATITGTATQTE